MKRKLKSGSEFSADRPIPGSKHDKLGRTEFASRLTERIRNWAADESLVIALVGEWGCGKSSVKNMVLERLRDGRARKLDILEFCPWEVSQHGSISSVFIRELEATLGRSKPDNLEPLVRKIRQYGKVAGLVGMAAKVTGGVLRTIGREEAVLLEASGAGLEHASTFIDTAANARDAVNQSKVIPLVELKKSLSAEMAKLRRPVLAIIDDIDRLTNTEIRELFQLIKANVDFPNLIFLLLYDRRIVSEALGGVSGNRGDEYLEKIVQVSFHIPDPLPEHVHKVLFAGIDGWLEQPGMKANWEQSRWARVWGDGFGDYFDNLRAVHRFLASFGFQVSLNHRAATFELNPLDVLMVEALRLFEPFLFEALPRYRNLLVGNRRRHLFDSGDREKARVRELEELLNVVPAERRQRAHAIIGHLFPRALGHVAPDDDTLLRGLRAGHDKAFDSYFSLGANIGGVSEAEIQEMLKTIEEPEAFCQVVQALADDGKLKSAFSRIDSHRHSLQSIASAKFVTSLVNAGDFLPSQERLFAEPGPLTVAWRLIYFSLRQIESSAERLERLKAGLSEARGVRLAVEIAHLEQRNEHRSSHDFLVEESASKELSALALAKIRDAARDGRLRKMPDFGELAMWWNKWAGGDEPKIWIKSVLALDVDALWILTEFANTQSETSGRTIVRRYIRLDWLEQFADVSVLGSLTKGVRLAELSQSDARILKAFRYALKWRKEGKPKEYTGGKMGYGPLDLIE